MEEAELRHERVAGDGVDLHVVTGGTGPPVILLHGFPENWHSWRWQIPALVAAGFSVLVPDMRGYNLSSRPVEQSAYRLDHLVADVVALVQASGHSPCAYRGTRLGRHHRMDIRGQAPRTRGQARHSLMLHT